MAEPKRLPERGTRGKRMRAVMEVEADADDEFWTQEFFADEERDEEYKAESDSEDEYDESGEKIRKTKKRKKHASESEAENDDDMDGDDDGADEVGSPDFLLRSSRPKFPVVSCSSGGFCGRRHVPW